MFFSVSGRGWLYSSFLVTSFAGLGSSVYISHSLVARKLEKELEVIRLNMHKQRGELASPPTPESTEWLNALVEVVC